MVGKNCPDKCVQKLQVPASAVQKEKFAKEQEGLGSCHISTSFPTWRKH